jgi:hypothetical protein
MSRAEKNPNVVGPVTIYATEKEKQERLYIDGALSGTSRLQNCCTLSYVFPLVTETFMLIIIICEVQIGWLRELLNFSY